MEFQTPNETGRKTFFWYRVYCTVLALLYIAVAVFGIFIAVVQPQTSRYETDELVVMGWIYAILGIVFFIVFAIASTLPPKPYNWIVGIVMLAIGMTSCCLLPAVVPLFIFWIKPETQAFFGRKQTS